MHINSFHDYTRDIKNFWVIHWKNNPRTGKVSAEIDPDGKSQNLKYDQYQLYRRELPNGEFFDLRLLLNTYNLVWGNKEFSSDSIIVSFRQKDEKADKKSKEKFDAVDLFAERKDYKEWVKKYLAEAYTIGGEIIFPTAESINQARGPLRNPAVADRFDLTLECINHYYDKTESEYYRLNDLIKVIQKNGWFFDKFVNFKGYVDFFLLQDFVNEDYSVKRFIKKIGRPETLGEYETFMNKQMECLRGRNKRIAELELEEWPALWVKKVNGEYIDY